MSDERDAVHTLRLRLDRGWSMLYLHCEHGKEMPWHGNYDEYGTLLNDDLNDRCWAKELADEASADEHLELPGELDDVRLPMPVDCWFDGDGLCIAPTKGAAT